MRKLFLILSGLLPVFLSAQNRCDFFSNNTIEIEKAGINSVASDFGPSFVKNELWFSTFTENEISKILKGATKNVFYNLFAAPVDFNGTVVSEKQIKLEKLHEGYHGGPVSYCSATNELFCNH